MPSNYLFVFARYTEDISWIIDNPFIRDRCVIYNKNLVLDNQIKHSKLNVINLSNDPKFARESGSYLNHIINEYNNISDYTIFSQASPFDHQKYFIELTRFCINNKLFKDFQPLTYCWKLQSQVPPLNHILYDKSEYIDRYPIYMEILSNALETISYTDTGMIRILNSFMEYHKIINKTDMLKYIYDRLKIKAPYANYIKFNYGGIFGVAKNNILQHSLDYYKMLLDFVNEHWTHGFIMERFWYTIFNKY